jgi:hypothetical protein
VGQSHRGVRVGRPSARRTTPTTSTTSGEAYLEAKQMDKAEGR